jgi:hypothetical protein
VVDSAPGGGAESFGHGGALGEELLAVLVDVAGGHPVLSGHWHLVEDVGWSESLEDGDPQLVCFRHG